MLTRIARMFVRLSVIGFAHCVGTTGNGHCY